MPQETPALVFGPGLPPGGVVGTLSVSALGVETTAGERSQRVPLSEVSLREVGFNQFGVEFSWTDAGEHWAAHVLDTNAAQELLSAPALASSPNANALRNKRRRNAAGRSIGWTVLAVFVALPVLLLLALLFSANRIAGWIAEKIPVEQEMEWGKQAFAGMRGELKLKDGGAAYDAVQTIGSRLTAASKYKYEFHVADDKSLNAFAMPGGIIVVHSGLIAATRRPEELAGVLAHEVQHVELRHSIRGMIKDLGLRGLWAFATGDLGGTFVGQAALEMTSLKFSRDDESEADSHGFEALVSTSIDPSGMPAFFKTMSEQSADAPAAFLSTHPLSTEREATLQKRVAETKRAFTPLDLGTWPPS